MSMPGGTMGTIRVTRMLVMKTGSYNQMFSRPYMVNFNTDTSDALNRRIRDNTTNGSASTTASLMSGIAGGIMRPVAQAEAPIGIINGWEQPRGRFLMVVEVTHPSQSVQIYYIQGFTSHHDLSTNGQPDPNMMFYINSYVRLTRVPQVINGAIVNHDVVTENAQVINGQLITSMTQTELYAQRPHDVFGGMQAAYLNQAANSDGGMRHITDNRSAIGGESIRNSRANNTAGGYIAKMVDAYTVGVGMSTYGEGNSDVMSRSKENTYEAPLIDNPFIRTLSAITGRPNCTSFYMQDLLSLDPYVKHPDVTKFIMPDAKAMGAMHRAGQTAYWQKPDLPTQAATIIMNALPAILMDMMVTNITFSAHNHDSAGINNVTIEAAKDLLGRPAQTFVPIFRHRFVNEIMSEVTHGNSELYQLKIWSDLFNDTIVDLQLGVEPMTRYVVPSFSDSLFVPIMTVNQNTFQNNVGRFDQILQHISVQATPTLINTSV